MVVCTNSRVCIDTDHSGPKMGSPKAKGFVKLGHNKDSCVTYYSDVNRDPS